MDSAVVINHLRFLVAKSAVLGYIESDNSGRIWHDRFLDLARQIGNYLA